MNVDEKERVLARHLAANLRQARERQGLTQNALAARSEIPRSTLASIETGHSNPTLSVLAKLSAALQVSLEELLTPAHADIQHFPHGSLPIRNRGATGQVEVRKLLPDPIPGMEIDRLALKPGAQMRGTPHRSGTREYLYCESGAITLWVEGDRIDLAEGDVAAFPGDRRHSYRGAGTATATGFSVVVLAPAAVRS